MRCRYLAFALAVALSSVFAGPCLAQIRFTTPPTFTPSSDGKSITFSVTNLASQCQLPCFAAYTGSPDVGLFITTAPLRPPVYPIESTITYPLPGPEISGAALESPQPFAGYLYADSTPQQYSPPTQPGTYYLALIIFGADPTPGFPGIYDVYNFPGTFTVGALAPSAPPSTVTSVVEYYNSSMDHYFMTPVPMEISLCNEGVSPCGGWVPTGHSFNGFVGSAEPTWSTPVCRFFNDSFVPKSSHFYALQGGVCEETEQLFPDWQLETSNLFGMDTPASDGSCGPGYVPVYRMYNNGMGGAPNHRFTTDPTVRSQMLAAGWVAEGLGALGVAFCSPP